MTTEHFIEISDLYFQYQEKPIFKQLNLTVPKGKIVAVMGPSGTGKTTLLHLMGGRLQPQQGHICIEGKSLANLNHEQLYSLRQRMGLLFQNGALFTNFNVFENVAFPIREHYDLPEPIIRNLVLMKLEIVGLRGARHLMPSEISGGMARRVALARAIALDPQLIMYDEPFAGLDPISRGVIVKLIAEINKALNTTTVLVSHDVPEVLAIADYIYLLAEGRVISEGTAATLQQTQEPMVKQFIHGLADGSVPFHYPAIAYDEDLFIHD